jgi:selenium metabolism protein YedF
VIWVAKVMLLSSETLGNGDDMLGRLLMANFLRLLGDEDRHPQTICLLNSGVRLACEGHPCLEHMRRLQRLGTQVLICRTCLEYLDLADKVAVGQVSNMHDIQGRLLACDTLTL